jgi:hypothetical protein
VATLLRRFRASEVKLCRDFVAIAESVRQNWGLSAKVERAALPHITLSTSGIEVVGCVDPPAFIALCQTILTYLHAFAGDPSRRWEPIDLGPTRPTASLVRHAVKIRKRSVEARDTACCGEVNHELRCFDVGQRR